MLVSLKPAPFLASVLRSFTQTMFACEQGMDCGISYRPDDLPSGKTGRAIGSAIRPAALNGADAMSVTIHDVAPATQERCEQLIALVERAGPLPMTLLVVPRYHHQRPTPAFERWIETRLRRGDELALHGLTHLDEAARARGLADLVRRRWYTAGEGEFAALGHAESINRIDAGRRWFARRGWPLRGFVAPAWLLGAGAWAALAEQPLEYTCTLRQLIALPGTAAEMRALDGWSIVFSTRAAWRRWTSLAWNGALARRQQEARWMRFELHPGDAEHASIARAAILWIERACAAGRVPLTLGAVVDRFC